MFVTEQDAGVLEYASDRWVQLPGDLGLCAPNRPERAAISTVVISCTGRVSSGPEYAAPR